MDLKQLEYFVRVAELGSFTRASHALNIAQPALSRQVRLLEVELRQSLLTRNGRGALPTEAGQRLMEHARGILHQVALTREELGAARGALTGRVSIGLPPSLSKLVTVPLTREFRQRLPDAPLKLTEGFSLLMNEGLRLGHLDAAVLYNPTPSADLEMSQLNEEALVLVSVRAGASPKGRVQMVDPKASSSNMESIGLVEVASLPLIAPSRPNAFRMLIESEMARIDCKPTITLEVDSLNAILDLVKEGMGHAVLPAYTLHSFAGPHPFFTRRIVRPRLMSRLMLVWSSRRPNTATQREAMRIIRGVVLGAIQR